MIEMSLGLAGFILAFELLQAVVAGAVFAVLIWYAKKRSDRRGEPA